MDLQPVLDFIEFSLLPYLSHKEIQLIQLKITQARPKQKDAFYLECFYYQKAVDLIRKYRRNAPHAFLHGEHHLYSTITKMEPADLILLMNSIRYKISKESLALILKKPVESLDFRRNQLLQEIQNDGFKAELEKLKSTQLADLAADLQKRTEQTTSSAAVKQKLSKINQLPAPLKFVLEMAGVLLLLFFIMWLVPQVRNTYENSVQKRINEYLIDASLTDSPLPEGMNKPRVIEPEQTEPPAGTVATEDNKAGPAETPIHKQPKVNEGETWRFSFTGGQGQLELDAKVSEIIESKAKQKVKPLVVPGGLQLEFTLPTSQLIPLKSDFEDLTATLQRKSGAQPVAPGAINPGTVNMSWYKKRNLGQRKIPSGNVLVIVWISTL